MTDLTLYIDAVLDDQDKILMKEASDCLAAGARRAAYITVWLACAESLRRKFNEAAVRDHEAGRIAREIAQLEAQHRAVDSFLIEKAKAYGFVTDAEATRLRHLYENRNVFGHPYEQSPSEQLVITAASEAVDIVLGRPVALREGYLSAQVTRLTADPTFLADDEEIVADYARTVHARSAADRRVYFVRKLLDACAAIFADPSLDLLQRRAVRFIRAFLLADPAIFDTWDPVDDLPDHRECLPGILAHEELFPLVSAHAQDIVVNVLVQQAPGEPVLIDLLYDLRTAGVLAQRHDELLAELIDGTPISRLASSGMPLSAWWQRLVERLAHRTWDVQNDAILVLRRAGRAQVADLTDEQQELIGRAVLAAADGTAFRATNLVGEVGCSDGEWPGYFVRGLVLECFAHEDGDVRLKTRELRRALRTLTSVSGVDRAAIIDAVVEAIEHGDVRHPDDFSRERGEAVEILGVVAGEDGLEGVARVRDALVAVDIQEDDEDG